MDSDEYKIRRLDFKLKEAEELCIPKLVLYSDKITTTDKIVYAEIRRLSVDGVSVVKNKELAFLCGMSIVGIKKCLEHLSKQNFIIIELIDNGGSGRAIYT